MLKQNLGLEFSEQVCIGYVFDSEQWVNFLLIQKQGY